MRGQDLIATRAQISSYPQQADWINKFRGYNPNPPDEETYFKIKQAMLLTSGNVVLYLFEKSKYLKHEKWGAHEVLAYSFNSLEGLIYIYDPNAPGKSGIIQYDLVSKRFSIYDGRWDGILLHGYGSLSNLDEDYENIFLDAEENFHGSADTIINVATHASGQILDRKNITISGTIESGQVLVKLVKVLVGKNWYPASVAPDGSFSVNFDLMSGVNHLRFGTWGLSIQLSIQQTYNNLLRGTSH